MTLPVFRYHPDPIRSGSIEPSTEPCRCCGQARGYLYTGPVYAEEDLDDAICPWCILNGSANAKYDASFVDVEAFDGEVPDAVMEEVCFRTPGYSSFQAEQWPVCCDDATAFLAPVGYAELQGEYREFEGSVLNHIIYDIGVSGGAATKLLESLNRDNGPTAYLFRCLKCGGHHVHVDQV